MDQVKVVVAHAERVTLRAGDVFLKVDADQARIDVEAEAMSLAPIPTPQVLWRKPSVVAIAALPGTALGRLGGPSAGSPAAWAAAGAAIPEGTTGRCRPGRAGPDGASSRWRRNSTTNASCLAVRWLIGHGFDPFAPGCEVDILSSRM